MREEWGKYSNQAERLGITWGKPSIWLKKLGKKAQTVKKKEAPPDQ